MMKKKISMIVAGLGLCASLILTTMEVHATVMPPSSSEGTLYGNASGTSFCCKSGTNDCGASSCG